MHHLKDVQEYGQSIWLDYIRRNLLTSGELKQLVAEGLRGVTSNPTIFQKAIAQSNDYDEAIHALLKANPAINVPNLYEHLAVEDIQMACNILRPVYDESNGTDGFVSLEVSPHLAYDTDSTIAEARHLWQVVDRPNLMIKVPATPQGVPAIETLIAEGTNVNVTLIFSLEQYDEIAHAYIRGVAQNSNPQRVASVASFFVSRIDTYTDMELENIGTPEALNLRGQAAVASSKLAYRRFREVFFGEEFASERQRSARVQRALWGSTSTKNPAYPDLLYVEELIGPDTVNTLPPETIDAFRDHGKIRSTLLEGIETAEQVLADLQKAGVNMDNITEQLQEDGVKAFADSFDQLLSTLEEKRQKVLAKHA